MTYYITTLQLPPYCALLLCSKVYMYVRTSRSTHPHARYIIICVAEPGGNLSTFFSFFFLMAYGWSPGLMCAQHSQCHPCQA